MGDQAAGIGDLATRLHLDDQASQGRIATGLLQVDLVAGRHHEDLAVRGLQGSGIPDLRGRRDDPAILVGVDPGAFQKLDGYFLLVAIGVEDEIALGILAIHLARSNQRGPAVLIDDLGNTSLKGFIADIQGAGHERIDIDLGLPAEDEPILIEQIHLPVGRQLAENPAGILLEDPVQRHGRGGRLLELDGIFLADIEALPIQDGLIGILIDGHLVAGDHLIGTAQSRQGGTRYG